MANYIKRGNTIIISDSTKLTEQDKADIALYRSFGYEVKITRKKVEKQKKAGYSKVEIIYYLEQEAPADVVKAFIEKADNNYMQGFQWFKAWFIENKAEVDKNGKKIPYNGEAAALIDNKRDEAQKRIAELNADEEKKRNKKKAKKNK